MTRLFVWMLALIGCLAGPGSAWAAADETPYEATVVRTPPAFGPRLDIPGRLFSPHPLAGTVQPARRGSSRDSLRNGAIIGAIAGAAGAGAFTALICRLYQEEGGAGCWSDALRGAALGAAIGTGAGLAIDARLTRQQRITVRIRATF